MSFGANGNILTVTDSSGTVSYTYDTANQLITETNEAKEYHNVWTYDDAGNILARMECEYIDGVVESIDDQYNYTYGDSQWGDLLTVYDTQALTYDEVGNLTGDGQWTYTWKHGRQLTSMTRGNTTWTFTYDANGMRTGRSPGFEQSTYTYVYNGDKLSRMTVEGMTFDFTYDINGTPLTITLDESFVYYYETNLQGDVIGILDSSGARVVSYAYDAWGNVQITQNYQLAEFNPLLYRGYVYDFETGLYYLQSRYYNPKTGRFINADAYAATGQGFVGNNMFVYCGNNPISRIDPEGNMYCYKKEILLGSGSGGVVGAGLLISLFYLIESLFVPCTTVAPGEKVFQKKIIDEKEKTDYKAIAVTDTISEAKQKSAVYYGMDLYGGINNIVTPPMSFKQAAVWAVGMAASGHYTNRQSWGLYTLEYEDALAMALFLTPIGPVSLDPVKGSHLAHFHTANRFIFDIPAKSFHIWYERGGV